MPYDNTLPDAINRVRHLIGDVYASFQFLVDDEIQFALDQNNANEYRAGADCCRAIAARVARNTDYRFSTLWQDSSQAYAHFMKLAKELEGLAAKKIGLTRVGTAPDDDDQIFTLGQFDNPGAGVQAGQ